MEQDSGTINAALNSDGGKLLKVILLNPWDHNKLIWIFTKISVNQFSEQIIGPMLILQMKFMEVLICRLLI